MGFLYSNLPYILFAAMTIFCNEYVLDLRRLLRAQYNEPPLVVSEVICF